MKINEFFEMTRKETVSGSYSFLDIRPGLTCADGTTLSVQASHTHYCKPRDNYGPYYLVEVGYPSADPGPQWDEYKDGKDSKYDETVFGYVPLEMVEAYIESHGGIASYRCLSCHGKGQIKIEKNLVKPCPPSR